MNIVLNIVWAIFAAIPALCWFLIGVVLCVTIIGIPFGVQCFKIARLTLWPFGYDTIYPTGSMSLLALLLNILWILPGVTMAIVHLVAGLILLIPVITIPFAIQHLKLAKISLLPFGLKIVPNGEGSEPHL